MPVDGRTLKASPLRDPRVDAYIDKAGDFAKPILKHLRELVHTGCPGVEETFKWSFPNFMHHGIMCNMASFKSHCSFGFWKADLVFPAGKAPEKVNGVGMGDLRRIMSLADLPADDVLIGWIKDAARLNEAGIKSPSRAKPKEKKEVVVPDHFLAALKKHKKALAVFEKFSPSHRREYVEWITEAKTEPTRKKRLDTALEWLAEGKPRNWKYMNC
jgi:uncharacterized protein YdeI (YjbR/CyaY-like superfamily)